MSFIARILSEVPLKVWVWAFWLTPHDVLAHRVAKLRVSASRPITPTGSSICLAGNSGRLPYDGTKFENAIIITDRDCASLGPGWATYAPIGGRFLVGAGQGRDINGVVRSFSPHQEDTEGEYVHRLSIAEMPKHSHEYVRGTSHSRRCDGDCSARGGGERGSTEPAGESSPHNNLPPYSVVNFCKLRLD